MKIYIDLILFLNFSMDLLLLISVSFILRRNVSFNRLLIGAFVGSLSILILFMNINSFELFFIKLLISIVMVIVSFNYKNIKYTLKNLSYLYMTSIILGGFLYFLNIEFSYKNEGLIFFHNGLSINYIFLIISSPIIIYFYVKQSLYLKNNYSNYYMVDIYVEGKIIRVNAFLDSGNKLADPITKKNVILINHDLLKKIKINKYFFVPYHTIDKSGIVKCFKPDKIYIKNIGFKTNLLVGIIDYRIRIDGIDCLLNSRILEE